MALPTHSLALRLFDPEHFCTGLGEETRKLVALPLVMSGSVVLNAAGLGRSRIVASGTSAVLETQRTTTLRRGGWQQPDVVNLATNIEGVRLVQPASRLMQRSVLAPVPPLGKALTAPMLFTCVRLVTSHAACDHKFQEYAPGEGWRDHDWGTWGFTQVIGSSLKYLVCKKIGFDGAQSFNRPVQQEERTKYAQLFQMFDRLQCTDEHGNPEEPKNLESYVNPMCCGFQKLDGKSRSKQKTRRFLAPEDLVEAGYIDDVEDVRIRAVDEYGSERAPRMYKLRLKPVMAMPRAELMAGRVPAEVLSAVKGTTVDDLQATLAASKLDWPDIAPGLQWVQIAVARVYPNSSDKY